MAKSSVRRRTTAARRAVTATRAAAATVLPTIRYMESSALVAALLEHDAAAMAPVPADTARAIVRARVTERLTADQEHEGGVAWP